MQYFESDLAFLSEMTSSNSLPVFNLIDFLERKYCKLLIDRKVEFISAMQRNLCYKLKIISRCVSLCKGDSEKLEDAAV